MKTNLKEDGQTLEMQNGDIYNVDQIIVNLECVNADIKIFNERKEKFEDIISQAKNLGYLTPIERQAEQDRIDKEISDKKKEEFEKAEAERKKIEEEQASKEAK